MADMIWIRGEQPFADATIVSETSKEVVYERAGKKTTVPSRDVRALRHGDTPGELEHAFRRMEKGDFRAAEKLLEPLESRGGWVRAHAGFHRANARRLRAELEGTGHDEALALLQAWSEREGDHYLAPMVTLVTGDAALVAGKHDVARGAFERLAKYGEHTSLASRLGLARVDLATGKDVVAKLEAIENDALVPPGDADIVSLARITRAAALGKAEEPRKGLELLLPLLDTPGILRSPWHGAMLNTIAELFADFAGRGPDGAAKPQARLAAITFINRAVRYAADQPVERAKTLAMAVEANTLAGRDDIAALAKAELVRRFPTSVYAKAH
ncbi:MAG TPA: hypothetical protein VFF73_21905 [Planctomycetota bacterium]|nr:hypothetical protein [Planctomycetota bacterium]